MSPWGSRSVAPQAVWARAPGPPLPWREHRSPWPGPVALQAPLLTSAELPFSSTQPPPLGNRPGPQTDSPVSPLSSPPHRPPHIALQRGPPRPGPWLCLPCCLTSPPLRGTRCPSAVPAILWVGGSDGTQRDRPVSAAWCPGSHGEDLKADRCHGMKQAVSWALPAASCNLCMWPFHVAQSGHPQAW